MMPTQQHATTVASHIIDGGSAAHTYASNEDGLSVGWITLVCLILFIIFIRLAYVFGHYDRYKDGNGKVRAELLAELEQGPEGNAAYMRGQDDLVRELRELPS